jgi:uncharacterized protein
MSIDPSDPADYGTCRLIHFTADGLRLEGVLHLPPGDPATPPPVVVGAHGLYASGDSPKQTALAQRVTALGIAYFRFDHRGRGGSEGDFDRVTTLDGRCRDLLAAIETLRARPEIGDGLGLFGSSMGGAVCLAAAGQVTPDAMVTVAAPVRIDEDVIRAAGAENLAHGVADLAFDLSDQLSGISRILVVHGEADAVIPVENARRIHSAAGDPKDLIIQPGGDHRISAPRHQADLMDRAGEWFARHLRRRGPARA